jgi:hypothetical protein
VEEILKGKSFTFASMTQLFFHKYGVLNFFFQFLTHFWQNIGKISECQKNPKLKVVDNINRKLW